MKPRWSSTFLMALFGIVVATWACQRFSLSPERQRREMVRTQIEGRGIREKEIVHAFLAVPREEFALPRFRDKAYDDLEVPLGYGQTLDRPYEDALIIQSLKLKSHESVLEVGTGSGYLSAVMSLIAKEVYTIEIVPEISDLARGNLSRLGFQNVHVRTGDGFLGWPEHAPFNAIVLTCSPAEVPKPLVEQLAEGGRLILPLGGAKKFQEIILYIKENGRLVETSRVAPTTFVPMKGRILERQ